MRRWAIYKCWIRCWHSCRGASILEFTVLFPFLLVLALGAFEFGQALHHHHIVKKAVRDSARFLARVQATCPPGADGADLGTITNAADITSARNLALTGITAGGGAYVLNSWTNPASVAVAVDCFDNAGGTYRGQSSIPTIRVTATLPYQDLGFLTLLGLSAMTFVIDHEQLHIGE